MSKLVVVTGGARSGKSTFAERYAAKYGKRIAYIATSQVLDEEMAFRVALHQKRRPAEWQTYEAPFDAHLSVEKAVQAGCDMILFDCLTVYISNLLCSEEKSEDWERNYQLVRQKCEALLGAVRRSNSTLVVVTNEVGAGIVPVNQLAREFRDLAGLANQLLAKEADEAYLVTMGIAVDLKKFEEKI